MKTKEREIRKALREEYLRKEFPLFSEKDIEEISKLTDLIHDINDLNKEKVNKEKVENEN